MDATRFIRAMPRGGACGDGTSTATHAAHAVKPSKAGGSGGGGASGYGSGAGASSSAAAVASGSGFASGSGSGSGAGGSVFKPSVDQVEEVVRRSCIAAFLTRELRGCAFPDMVARKEYYTSLMEATLALAQSTCAGLLINGRTALH